MLRQALSGSAAAASSSAVSSSHSNETRVATPAKDDRESAGSLLYEPTPSNALIASVLGGGETATGQLTDAAIFALQTGN